MGGDGGGDVNFFDVTIQFVDGTVEKVEYVTTQEVRDGVLHLYQREGMYGPRDKYLGSWPIANITKWTRSDR